MASPVKIKRSQKQTGSSGGKRSNHAGGAPPSKPIHLILATVAVTALLISAASYLLPPLPSRSPSPQPDAEERQPLVPFPPIGQSKTTMLPQPAAPPVLPPAVDLAPMPARSATAPMPAPPAPPVPAAPAPPAAPPLPSPAPSSASSPASGQPRSEGKPGDVVQQALQDAARLAAVSTSPPPPAAPAVPPAAAPAKKSTPDRAAKPAPAVASTAEKDPPITAEERAHKNSLVAARVEKVQGRCLLRVTSASPLMRYKWLQLENPPRVALDLVGSWDVNAMTRDRGDGLCVRELRLGRHADRVRVVVELAGGSTTGPKEVVVEKISPKELLITLPHR